LRFQLSQAATGNGAGVVDQDVDGGRERPQGLHAVAGREIGAMEGRRHTDLVLQLRHRGAEGVLGTGGEVHFAALASEVSRTSVADAARGAGDEHALA
jgi:hypothetical protein